MVNFCPNCGKKIEPGSKFCSSCGNRIIDSENSTAQKPATDLKKFSAQKPIEDFQNKRSTKRRICSRLRNRANVFHHDRKIKSFALLKENFGFGNFRRNFVDRRDFFGSNIIPSRIRFVLCNRSIILFVVYVLFGRSPVKRFGQRKFFGDNQGKLCKYAGNLFCFFVANKQIVLEFGIR